MQRFHNTCETHPHVTQLLDTKIYTRRRRMNISQNALADQAGLTRNCIQQIECHEHLPRLSTLFHLMKALQFNAKESSRFMEELQTAYVMDQQLQRERDERLETIP